MTFVDLSGEIGDAAGAFDLYMALSAGSGQLQRLLQVVTINYRFPQSWVDFANSLRAIIDFDFPSLAEPECQIKLSALGGVLLRTQMVALMIPAIVAVVSIGVFVKKRRGGAVGSIPRILLKVAVALHSMFFIILTKSALAPFDCTNKRLDKNNGALCDDTDSEYVSLMTWGAIMLFVYGGKTPIRWPYGISGFGANPCNVSCFQSSSLCFIFRTGALFAACCLPLLLMALQQVVSAQD